MDSVPSVDDASLALDELRHLVQSLRSSSHAVEGAFGISGAQLFVLREIAAEPGASIRRLSQRTLTDPSSVSVVVSRLVERGLVVRKQDSLDGRRSVLSISRKGTALLARAPEPYQARLIVVLRQMRGTRLRQLRLALSEIVDALRLKRGAAPLFFETASTTRKTATTEKKRRATR